MMKLNRIIYILSIVLLASSSLTAQERGGYAGVFLRMGLGARANALGGAYITEVEGSYSNYYNPAGLGGTTTKEAAMSYRALSLDRSFSFIGISLPLPPAAGFSVGWIHAGVDNIDSRNLAGQHIGSISAGENAFMFGFGLKPAEKLQIGVGGTLIRNEMLDLSASGFGMNLGIIYTLNSRIKIAAAVRDLGAHYSWNSEDYFGEGEGSSTVDDFPAVFTGGVSYLTNYYNTLVIGEVYKNAKSEAGYHFGLENNYFETFTLRGGLNNGDITAGFGMDIPILSRVGVIDYALSNRENDPEINHIFSLKIIF